jgi:hypothetical protein
MKKVIIVIVVCLLIPVEVFALPESYSNELTRIDNQGNSYQCVAYAVCNAVEAQMLKEGKEVPEGGFSKAWLYAKCKEIDGIRSKGTTIKAALQIAKEEGLCPYSLCPTKRKLTKEMSKEASKYKIDTYCKVNLKM